MNAIILLCIPPVTNVIFRINNMCSQTMSPVAGSEEHSGLPT